MTKITYCIINGGNIIARMWENDNGEQVLIPESAVHLDFNFDLEVRDEHGTTTNHLDLRDFLLDFIKTKSQ